MGAGTLNVTLRRMSLEKEKPSAEISSSILAAKRSFTVVRITLAEAIVPAEDVADQMGDLTGKRMDLSRLENWACSPGKKPPASASPATKKVHSKKIDPLCRVDRFIQHTGDVSLLDWLADRRGGIFVPCTDRVDSPEQRSGTTVRDWYRIWSEIHALRGVIKEAFEDDRKFDLKEADRIAVRWLQVRRWIERVMLRWFDRVPELGSVNLSSDADQLQALPSWAVFGESMEQFHEREQAGLEDPGSQSGILTSQKALAQHVGLSREAVRNWWKRPEKNHRKSNHLNPLDECLALMESTRSNRPLEWLASRHGGCVVPGCRQREAEDLLRDWMNTHLEWAELECAVGRYVLGITKVNKLNLEDLRTEWEDVKECMPTLLAAIYRDAVRSFSEVDPRIRASG